MSLNMAQRILLSPKTYSSLINGIYIRCASNYGYSRPDSNSFQDNQGARSRSRPLGDQRTHYIQHQRHTGRARGETHFNQREQFYRPNNVSGFGGRGRMSPSRGMIAGMSLRPINWEKVQLQPLNKQFYTPHEAIDQRNQSEIDEWLQANDCTIHGTDIPRPIINFNESGFPEPIVDYICKNFNKPTPIQCITWPGALTGRDMISIAMTGSGKTLGFILPAITHILGQPPRQRGDGPTVLVLLPTRELAQQVESVAREYCAMMGLDVTSCYGGVPKQTQGIPLRKGVDICVACPGRMLDFLEGGATNMRRCSYLVVDEADRMLDMGFEPQIRAIVGQIRPDRQTLMFSATWPRDVRTLASDFLNNPIHLNVGSLELAANHNIQQRVEVIDEYSKMDRLFELLSDIMLQSEPKTLIFAETKRTVDELTNTLRREGLPVLCIHGDKSQTERDWVLNEFRANKTPIVIATEVAARGLDVNNIKYVINFDYPSNAEAYVHRIGRTGRQDKTGTAYTFFTPQDGQKARDLINILKEANQTVPEELKQLCY